MEKTKSNQTIKKKSSISKLILLFIGLFTINNITAQEETFLDAKLALQKSEIVRAVPQESNGYLVLHKNEAVDYWMVNALRDGEVVETYQTLRGENHIKMKANIYNDPHLSFKINGISETGENVLDIDVYPIIDELTWVLNECNRPTCVKTSGGTNYAYGMEIYENVNNDSYRLKLQKAWSHYDTTLGIQIPYYIEVSQSNLAVALSQQGHTPIQGTATPQLAAQTYFPAGNGNYKVALGMGQWQNDWNVSTNPINGTGGEGCTLTFNTALNRMNASAQLSTPLTCSGNQYSANQSGSGDNPFSVGDYANASSGISNICFELLVGYNLVFSHTDHNGVNHYTWVNNSTTFISLDCDDQTPTGTNGPCPPGYYYSPGGGDPCKPIEPISDELHSVKMVPIDVPSGGGDENMLKEGLYLMVFNYDNGISIPIYKKIEKSISLEEKPRTESRELSIFPNPANDEITISLDEEEKILSYSILDHFGKEVKNGRFSSKKNQQNLELRGLRRGIYFLEIETTTDRYRRKIIKN